MAWHPPTVSTCGRKILLSWTPSPVDSRRVVLRWSCFAFCVLCACSESVTRVPDTGNPQDAAADAAVDLGAQGAVDSGTAQDVMDPADTGDFADADPRDRGTVDALTTDAGPVADVGEPGDAEVTDRGPPPVDPCITDTSAGAHTFSCMGLSFEVAVPAQCPAAGCGLILDVHGLSMSGKMAEANTALAARGSALDFVVIQPSATPVPPLASWTPNIDDPKVVDFLTRAQAVFQTDAKRVHMTGFSQGGYMSWRFLCANASMFASMAPGAASDFCPAVSGCNFVDNSPSEEIPILYLHGMNDPLVAFSCGESQIDAMTTAWNLGAPTIVSSDANYEHRRYVSAQGTPVEYFRHSYESSATSIIPLVPDLLGHCYPGSTDSGDEPGQLYSFACDPPNAFDWGQEVLDFFVAHPRP